MPHHKATKLNAVFHTRQKQYLEFSGVIILTSSVSRATYNDMNRQLLKRIKESQQVLNESIYILGRECLAFAYRDCERKPMHLVVK